MGVAVMSGEIDHLSRMIGRIEEQIKTLFIQLRELEENSTREHRTVHDIVVATSEAVRNLAHKVDEMKPQTDAVPSLRTKVDEMKPLTDDYRERRAEARGAAKLAHALYAVVGGLIGSGMTWVIQMITAKPHP